MSFLNNLEFLYSKIPAFYRRADAARALLLKRFLAWFGEEADGFDAQVDTLHEKVAAATAPVEFVEYFLWAMFGWAFFPPWFTPEMKRAFYADIAVHYARRGTKRGIEGLLAAFGIKARVVNHPIYWGEWAWGEGEWAVTGPLGMVVQIFPQTNALPEDLSFWGEFLWGEDVLASPSLTLTRVDYDELLRFSQPLATEIVIEEKIAA